MKKEKLLEIKNARVLEQRMIMQKIIKDKVCPFCEKNLRKYHSKPILFKTKNWIVTENAWPYKMTQKHFLVIARTHIDHSSNLSDRAWQEIGVIIKRLEKEFGLDYGTLLMRFGDVSKTGATVQHLHFQLVQSDPNHPKYNPKTGLCTRIG